MMRAQQGFTLIEMMLALAIFAVLSLTGYQILQAVLRSDQQIRQNVTRREEIGRLFALLDRDLSQAMIPAQDEKPSHAHPAFISNTPAALLQFTRRNGTLPASIAPRSSLQRVRWRLADRSLLREDLETNEIAARFQRIDRVQLRFWSAGSWQAGWPAAFSLPEAIEVTLHTPDYGQLSTIILLSGGQ